MAPKTNELAALKRKRGLFKSKITRINTFLNDVDESTDIQQIKIREEALAANFNEIYAVHDEILEIDPEGTETHNNDLIEIEEYYYTTLATARKFIDEKTSRGKATSNNQLQLTQDTQHNVFTKSHIRLPEISIPEFDGSIEKWQSFKSIFLSRIGNNDAVDPVDKITYLQSSLTGKAMRIIEAIDTSETNFEVAWDLLQRKYDNTRKAILKHWSILYNYQHLPKDTPDALNDLIDTFKQHIRSLKSLGEKIEDCNGCTLYLLLSKINSHTKVQWESTLPDNKMPKYTSLIEFLEKRGNCSDYTGTKENHQGQRHDSKQIVKNQNHTQSKSLLINSKNNRNSNNNKNKGNKSNIISDVNIVRIDNDSNDSQQLNTVSSNVASTSNQQTAYPCPLCQEFHRVYKCNTLIAASIHERKQLVKSASLCYNCLGIGHSYKDCKGSNCRICNQKHHTYLHENTGNTESNNNQ